MDKLVNDIKNLLIKYYPYGFRITSLIETSRFKKKFAQEYCYDVDCDDSSFIEIINNICVTYNDKAYYIGEDVEAKIDDLLTKYNSFSIVYYDQLFNLLSSEIDCIISSEMLEMLLRKMNNNYIYRAKYFVFNNSFNNEFSAIENDILAVWGDEIVRNATYLKSKLDLIPIDKIKYVLSNSNKFVWNSEETYVKVESFVFDDFEKNYILKYAKDSCDRIGFFNFNELKIDDVYEKNYEMSYSAVMGCVMNRILFEYDKVDKVIKRKGEAKSQFEIITDYCSHKKSVTIEELANYQKKITGTIRHNIIIDAASSIMIRIDSTSFVSMDSINFDSHSIDKSISEVFHEKSIGMKELVSFSSFPECGIPWNHFLLESYLKKFSISFEYRTNLSNSGNAGAIVRRNSRIDYFGILVDAVINSNCSLDKNSILEELVRKGYLLKRTYGRIDDLINAMKIIKK